MSIFSRTPPREPSADERAHHRAVAKQVATLDRILTDVLWGGRRTWRVIDRILDERNAVRPPAPLPDDPPVPVIPGPAALPQRHPGGTHA